MSDAVRMRVPEIDRGRKDSENILVVVMDVNNDLYKLRKKNMKL